MISVVSPPKKGQLCASILLPKSVQRMRVALLLSFMHSFLGYLLEREA